MCKELEAIGLPDPVFDNNTFILKTTIMSSSYQKLPIKLFRDVFLQACTNKNYNEPTIDNMKRVYDNIEANQVFSSAYIKKYLNVPIEQSEILLQSLRRQRR